MDIFRHRNVTEGLLPLTHPTARVYHKHQALPTLFRSVVDARKKFIFNKRFRTWVGAEELIMGQSKVATESKVEIYRLNLILLKQWGSNHFIVDSVAQNRITHTVKLSYLLKTHLCTHRAAHRPASAADIYPLGLLHTFVLACLSSVPQSRTAGFSPRTELVFAALMTHLC